MWENIKVASLKIHYQRTTTLSVMKLRIIDLYVTLSINDISIKDTQHDEAQNKGLLCDTQRK